MLFTATYKLILLPSPHQKKNKIGLKLVLNVNMSTETSSLRILKIMPRNLNKIVRSRIRLQAG